MKLKHGIASPSTITRMLSGIDEELALYAFMEWIGQIVDSKGTHLEIDGKALRGATEKVKGMTNPKIEYSSAIDSKATMATTLGVKGIPHVILIDPQGIVRWEGYPMLKGHELTTEVVKKIIEKYK